MGAAEYKARSGRIVAMGEDGSLSIDYKRGYLSPEVVMDVEEWAQAKRDAELGRWRWPENPDWIAVEGSREENGRTVVVVNERTLERFWLNDQVLRIPADAHDSRHAGRAYFEAHPERKPWQRAQVGEVWVLSTADGETDAYTAMPVRGGGIAFEAPEGRYLLDDADIESARRIWPEDAS